LAILKEKLVLKEKMGSKYDLRNMVVPESVNKETKWVLETPKEIRANASFMAHQHLKTAFKQLRNRTITHFDVEPESKKKLHWSLSIPKSAIKIIGKDKITIYPQKMKQSGVVRTTFKIPRLNIKKIDSDCKIHFNGVYYYFCVPIQVRENYKTREIKKERKFIVSCDPGERSFLTTYDNENNILDIGKFLKFKINRYLKSIDLLKSYSYKKNCKIKKRVRKRTIKMFLKIKNVVDDAHHHIAKFLVTNYDNVVIPRFNKNSEIVQLNNLNRRVKRTLSMMSHCSFNDTLKTKASFYNCTINENINERYTSQCCGNCGNLNKKLKSLKEWTCEKCKWFHDRDVNASRNILLKIFEVDKEDNFIDLIKST
jgi:putative transposase